MEALNIPEGVELCRDVSPADWVVSRLWPWGPSAGTGPTRVGSFVPSGFEAYARVLHPAYAEAKGGEIVRWKTLAERSGVPLGPTSTFAEVSGIPLGDRRFDDRSPQDGCLVEDEVRSLARMLAPFTTTPDRCWYCLWDGNGWWWDGAHNMLVSPGVPSSEIDGLVRDFQRISRDRDALMRDTPRVHAEHRDYFLMRGPLRHAASFPPIDGWYQSPNLWWPDDRAWCVVTEIDGYSTYAGGSRACVDSILASGDVEAIEVSLGDAFPTEEHREPDG